MDDLEVISPMDGFELLRRARDLVADLDSHWIGDDGRFCHQFDCDFNLNLRKRN